MNAEITAVVSSENVFSIRLLEDDGAEQYTDIIFNPGEGAYYAPMEESSILESVDKRPILGDFIEVIQLGFFYEWVLYIVKINLFCIGMK